MHVLRLGKSIIVDSIANKPFGKIGMMRVAGE
jgi:hypothetical protein